MARIKRHVDPQKLRQLIETLEKTKTFQNQNELFQAAADEPWCKAAKLTAAVIYLRVKEFNIPIKTAKGKRGRTDLKGGARKPKVVSQKIRQELTKTAKKYDQLKLVEKILSGSLKSAIKLKCEDCCNGDRKEIKLCTCHDCPLWLYRPYRSTETEENSGE